VNQAASVSTSPEQREPEREPEEASFPNCPACGRDDVRRSRSRGIIDLVIRAFGFRPYRCRACRTRYFSTE